MKSERIEALHHLADVLMDETSHEKPSLKFLVSIIDQMQRELDSYITEKMEEERK